MNTERDKFLTEAMGECWHDVMDATLDGYPVLQCSKCKVYVGDMSEVEYINRTNFSSWEGFGKLWEWSQKQEWWGYFVHKQYCKKGKQLTVDELLQNLINPDRFADAIYAYLKEKNNE